MASTRDERDDARDGADAGRSYLGAVLSNATGTGVGVHKPPVQHTSTSSSFRKMRGDTSKGSRSATFAATDIIAISRVIQSARARRGLTISEVAKRSTSGGGSGIASELIQSYENASVREVSASVLRTIGRVLGVRIVANLYSCPHQKRMGTSWSSPPNTRMVRYLA